MNFDDPKPLDDRFLAEMAELDEAIAAGRVTTDGRDGDTSPEQQSRRQRDLECLERLQRLRPKRQSSFGSDTKVQVAHLSSDTSFVLSNGIDPSNDKRLGRFLLRRELGRGGFGVVFLAFDPTLGREVALKVPCVGTLVTPELRERFFREARSAAGLDHPNIVTVFEAGEIGPIQYITSAYCPGPTLAQEIKRNSEPFPFAEAAKLMAVLADAVAHAHARGIVHRDLKPSNVLLSRGESSDSGVRGQGPGVGSPLIPHPSPLIPKIADFGLSKQLEDCAEMTRSGAILGTPCYMAPEQARGKHGHITPAVDIYALGAICYELLTGRPPFRGETDIDTLQQVCHQEPVHPQLLRPKLPRDLATICLKCLQKERARRYRSASDFAADLRRYLADEPIAARPTSALEHAQRWCRRRPGLAAALAGLAAVTLLGFCLIFWQWQATLAALEKSAVASYFHLVNLAHREWLASNVGRASQLLSECREDLRHWEWRYVKHLCDDDLVSLERHSQPVTGVVYSPNNRYLATSCGAWNGTEPGMVCLWDANTGRKLWVGTHHTNPVEKVAFSPDSQLLASASTDFHGGWGEIIIWDVGSGCEIVKCKLEEGATCVAFSPDGHLLAAAGFDGRVKIWDLQSGQRFREFRGHNQNVFSIAFSPDGLRLISCGHDGVARVWDVSGNTLIHELAAPSDMNDMRSVAYSPDGKLIAIGSYDQCVKIWDARTFQEIHEGFWNHASPVLAVTFTRDSRYVVSSDLAGKVKIWDPWTNRELRTLHGHTGLVSGICCSPDGRRIATAGWDHTARVWDLTASQEAQTLDPETWGSNQLVFSRDGRYLIAAGWRSASGAKETRVRIWDRVQAGKPRYLASHSAALGCVSLSPDERLIASGSDDGIVKLWDIAGARELSSVQAHHDRIESVVFSPCGKYLASASRDKTVRIWNHNTGQNLFLLEHPHAVKRVLYTADGMRILTCGEKGMVYVWDVRTGQKLFSLQGHQPAVNALVLSPDGKQLATADAEGVIHIWDMTSNDAPRLLRTLRGHSESIIDLAYTHDGRRLASGSIDKTAIIWDVASGTQALALRDSAHYVIALAFSPDDLSLFASRGQIRIWDASDCTPETKDRQRQLLDRQAFFWHQQEALSCWDAKPLHWSGLLFHLREMFFGQLGNAPTDAENNPSKNNIRAKLLAVRARSLYQSGRLTEFLQFVPEALAANPHDPQLKERIGAANYQLGRLSEAEGTFRECLRHEPSNIHTRIRLIWTLLGLGKTSEVSALLQDASNQPLTQPSEQNALAWVLATAPMPVADQNKSLALAQDALHRQRCDLSILTTLAACYQRLGQLEQIAALAKNTIESPLFDKAPQQELDLLLGEMLVLSGDLEGYQSFCTKVEQRWNEAETDREAYLLARLFSLAPNAVAAEKKQAMAKYAVTKNKDLPWHWHTLALQQYRAGSFAEAIESCQAALKLAPNGQPWRAKALNWLILALASHQLGKTEDAQRWYEQATQWIGDPQGWPQEPHYFFELGLHPHDWLALQLLRQEAQSLIRKQE